MKKSDRFKMFIEYFIEHQPDAETELEYRTPYELLVAVILSAQCTDKRVNIITVELFKSYPTAESLSVASIKDVFEHIKSCSYPYNKSKYLVGMAKKLTEEFKGIVPSDINDLQKLPGVGRKTANVVASVAYNKPAMAVDTHVFRVAERVGLTTNAKNPLQSEKQLVKYIPEEKINLAHHWLILHGRYICQARKPKCDSCGITKICKYFTKYQ